MSELNMYVAEFVAVTAYLLDEQQGQYVKTTKYAVDKALLCELLDNNKYDESAAKLHIWKQLHWIETDKNHTTQVVRVKGKKQRSRMVVISLDVHEMLAKLLEQQAVTN